MVIMDSLYFLYIFIYFFLYRVNQCRVQLGTNKVVVVAASIHLYLTETDVTHMDDFSIFLYSRQYLKKLLNGAAVHLSFICLFV